MPFENGREYYDESYRCQDCEVEYPHLHILPMEAVLKFESCDAWRKESMIDVIDRKRGDDRQTLSLRELICQQGFKPGYGIGVDDLYACTFNYVHDGHHRLTVMYDLGAKWCPVQLSGTHYMDTPEYAEAKAARYKTWIDELDMKGMRL